MAGKKKIKIFFWLIPSLILLIAAFFLLKDIILRNTYPLRFESTIKQVAGEYKLDPYMVASVIWAESKYEADIVSKKGAVGLMQIMPDTGEWIAGKLKIKDYNENRLTEPELNIRMGCWYLNYLNGKFPDDNKKILAAYNAGPNKVLAWLKNREYSPDGTKLENIPFEETKNYVEKIVRAYDVYKSLYKMQ